MRLALFALLLPSLVSAQVGDNIFWINASTPFSVNLAINDCSDSSAVPAPGAVPGGSCEVIPPVPRPTGLELPIGCSITAANAIKLTACTKGILSVTFPSSVAVKVTTRSP